MGHLKNIPLDTIPEGFDMIPEGFEEYWTKFRKRIIICYLERAGRSLQRQ